MKNDFSIKLTLPFKFIFNLILHPLISVQESVDGARRCSLLCIMWFFVNGMIVYQHFFFAQLFSTLNCQSNSCLVVISVCYHLLMAKSTSKWKKRR